MTDQITNLANFYETELTSEFGSTDLVAQVLAVGAVTSPAYVVIDPDDPTKREVILFDDTFTVSQLATSTLANRYLAGSAAGSGLVHSAGAIVRVSALAQHFEDLNDRITADRAELAEDVEELGDSFDAVSLLLTEHESTGEHELEATAPIANVAPIDGAAPGSLLASLSFAVPAAWASTRLTVFGYWQVYLDASQPGLTDVGVPVTWRFDLNGTLVISEGTSLRASSGFAGVSLPIAFATTTAETAITLDVRAHESAASGIEVDSIGGLLIARAKKV